MSATSHELATRAPHLHAVQLYHDDGALIRTVADFLGLFLNAGACAIVVATRAHRDGIAAHLTDSGFDITQAVRQGRYLSLDAAETLNRVMDGGRVDEARFAMVIGGLFQRAAMVSPVTRRHAGVFCEMVGLLADARTTEAAVDIERAWNRLAQQHAFSLVCGYQLGALSSREAKEALDRIRAEHTEVIRGPETTGSGAARSRGARDRRTVLRILRSDASTTGEAASVPAPPTADVIAQQLRAAIANHALPLEIHIDGEWMIATTIRQPGFALHIRGGTTPPCVHLYGDVPAHPAADSGLWAPLWRLLEAWGVDRQDLRGEVARHYPDLIDRML